MYTKSINIAASGLKAQGSNLDIIAQNIANKDTEGYKRLNPKFNLVQGGGVQFSASSNKYPWVDTNLSSKSMEFSKQTSMQDAADSLDNLFSNNNAEDAYAGFLNASKNLQTFPESKQHLKEFNKAGKFLNDSINQVSDALSDIQRNVKNKVELNRMELDALKSQLTQISSKGINESNINDVQLMQQRIADLTGSISGYNEFISSIMPPITYNFKKSTSEVMSKINDAGKKIMFRSDGEWNDQESVDNVAINNTESVVNFGDELGKLKVEVGVNSNTALLSTKFARNQYEQASMEYNDAYGVSLENETVNMMQAQRMFEANTKVLQASDNMIGSLLNVIG